MPAVRVEWHAAEALQPHGPVGPEDYDHEGYLPSPCVLHPERVTEYPSPHELSEDVRGAIAAVPDIQRVAHGYGLSSARDLYQTCLSAAPGVNVGGYKARVHGPERPTCPEGHAMALLLTIDSAEFGGASWHRWLAEEQDVWDGPPELRHAVQSAARILLDDMGNMHVYTCPACAAHSVETVFQCS